MCTLPRFPLVGVRCIHSIVDTLVILTVFILMTINIRVFEFASSSTSHLQSQSQIRHSNRVRERERGIHTQILCHCFTFHYSLSRPISLKNTCLLTLAFCLSLFCSSNRLIFIESLRLRLEGVRCSGTDWELKKRKERSRCKGWGYRYRHTFSLSLCSLFSLSSRR